MGFSRIWDAISLIASSSLRRGSGDTSAAKTFMVQPDCGCFSSVCAAASTSEAPAPPSRDSPDSPSLVEEPSVSSGSPSAFRRSPWLFDAPPESRWQPVSQQCAVHFA